MRAVVVGVAVALVAVAILPSTPAFWDQLHGDAGRSGTIPTKEGVFDVVSQQELFDQGDRSGGFVAPNLVETPHGLMTVVQHTAGGNCTALTFNPAVYVVKRTRLDGCQGGSFIGYDVVHDALLLCSLGTATEPVLQARDAVSGEILWSFAPIQGGQAFTDDSMADYRWSCGGGAIDLSANLLVVPFVQSRTTLDWPYNRVAAFRLEDGGLLWHTALRFDQAGAGDPGITGPADDPQGSPDIIPTAVTLTTRGIVVTGFLLGQNLVGPGYPPEVPENPTADDSTVTSNFAAWISVSADGDARVVRFMHSSADPFEATSGDPESLRPSSSGSAWAVGRDGRAALAMGDRLLVIDPSAFTVTREARLPTSHAFARGALFWAAPVWGDGRIFVPMKSALTAYDDSSMADLWTWSRDGWWVDDVALTDSGYLYVLITRQDEPGTTGGVGRDSQLLRLDPQDGSELQVLPFRAAVAGCWEEEWNEATSPTAIFSWRRFPVLVPVGSSFLGVVDPLGHFVLLGRSPLVSKPQLTPSNGYPRPGETVTLTVTSPPNSTVLEGYVRWGDTRTMEEFNPEEFNATELSHTYAETGDYEVAVTLLYRGQEFSYTATQSTIVHVGGTPPPPPAGTGTVVLSAAPERLNLMQVAFAEENQNLTFFFLGLFIALLTALAAMLARTRQRGRLTRKLRRLEQIRALSLVDLYAAIWELGQFRARIQSELLAGKLDDGVFNAIMLQAGNLSRRLLHQVTAPVEEKLSKRYRGALTAAFEDGFVNESEARSLRHALDREKGLTKAERLELGRILGQPRAKPTEA